MKIENARRREEELLQEQRRQFLSKEMQAEQKLEEFERKRAAENEERR
jgi:hypothetical protein